METSDIAGTGDLGDAASMSIGSGDRVSEGRGGAGVM